MKYRIRISFHLPANSNQDKIPNIVNRTFSVIQKLMTGAVEFTLPTAELSATRMCIVIRSMNVPPRADEIKLRLPQLKKLEIVDASLN